MPSAIETVALFSPIIASNAIFSARRASRGVDSMEDNPLFGMANLDIAAGQILKGSRAAKSIAIATDPALGETSQSASEAIKNMSKTNKLLKGAGKVLNFTAENINPIIVAAGGLKVLGADDKIDEAGRESTKLGCMFAAEALAKKCIGMPYTTKSNGKVQVHDREALYKKLFSSEQQEAIAEFVKTKKNVKYLAGGMKGLAFAGASIAGYQLGEIISDAILGKKEEVHQ